MRVEDVATELDVSVSYAYKIIKQLNNELKAKGFGHVSMEPYDPAKLKVPSEEIASGAWV